MSDNELKIEDYTLFRVDSYSRRTGGVVCYAHSSISIDIIDSSSDNNIWSLSLRILNGYVRDTFCIVYRGHKSSNNDFISFLERTFDFLSTNCKRFHVIGDFNYNYDDKVACKPLLAKLKSFSLSQIVKSPTREQNGTQTLIDWVVTNCKLINCHVINNNNIADHNFIAIDLFTKLSRNNTIITRFDWSTYSKANLTNHLSAIDWHNFDLIPDVNDKFMFIHESFQLFLSKTLTTKSFTVKSSVKWYTSELNDLKCQKIKAKNKWNTCRTDSNWKQYVKLRNLYKNNLRSSECNYLQSQLSTNNDDPKKLWSILKSIYSNDSKPCLSSLTFHDGIIHDNQTCADRLNEYFINSIVDISSHIPKINNHFEFSVTSCPIPFTFQTVSFEIVKNLIVESKKKYYCDNLTGKVLHDALESPDFLISFTNVLNMSLEHGHVPDFFKHSTITPIQKITNSNRVSDLRPINTLSVCSQILERIVKEQLLSHFEANNLFVSQQSGFRKFHSCESSIAYVISEWMDALDRNKIVIAVFLDLKRAFETIDRQLLLNKLALYGCDPTVLSWFGSYLSNRFQQTKFNGTFSTLLPIIFGIPQGSVLSCLLFIIFINDLVNVVKFSQMKLFADDTLVFIECDANNLEDAIHYLNSDLSKIFEWLCFSKLSLNVSKTKAMIISTKKVAPVTLANIEINGTPIELVESMKYLGVIIDRNLSFQQHHEDILKKLNKKFYVFKRCESKLTYESKKIFVRSLILSHFNYCSTISFLLNDTQLDEFQKVLNRFMRVILKCDNRTHRQDMLDACDWLSVKQLLNLNVLMFFHRLTVFESPDYIFFKLRKATDAHRYPTRRGDEYILPTYTKAFSQNSLFYKGLKLFNDFKTHLKTECQDKRLSIKHKAEKFVKTRFPLI